MFFKRRERSFILLISLILSWIVRANSQATPLSVSKRIARIIRKSDSVTTYSSEGFWPEQRKILKIISATNHHIELTFISVLSRVDTNDIGPPQIFVYTTKLKSRHGYDSLNVKLNAENLWGLDQRALSNVKVPDSNRPNSPRIYYFSDGADYKFELNRGDSIITLSAGDPWLYHDIPQLFNKERKSFIHCQSSFDNFWDKNFVYPKQKRRRH